MKLLETIEYMQQMHRLYGDIEIFIKSSWSDKDLIGVNEIAVYHDKVDPHDHWLLLSPHLPDKTWLKVVK